MRTTTADRDGTKRPAAVVLGPPGAPVHAQAQTRGRRTNVRPRTRRACVAASETSIPSFDALFVDGFELRPGDRLDAGRISGAAPWAVRLIGLRIFVELHRAFEAPDTARGRNVRCRNDQGEWRGCESGAVERALGRLDPTSIDGAMDDRPSWRGRRGADLGHAPRLRRSPDSRKCPDESLRARQGLPWYRYGDRAVTGGSVRGQR
jgi:hypothetical protein